MPVQAVTTPEHVQALLAKGPASATELAASVGVSVPTLHRLLQRLPPARLVRAGKARRTRYGLLRSIRGVTAQRADGLLAALSLYAVDAQGQIQTLAPFAAVCPEGSWLDLAGTDWPMPEESQDGWWDGLPYLLHQMRPHGYMGRQFARAQAAARGVSPNPMAWSDDDVLAVLTQHGADLSGNLLLGDAACERWLAAKAAPADPLPDGALADAYPALAERAVAAGDAESSAGGEFPKFTAQRALAGSATPHVIVKFSGADDSAAVRRWSDLLVCEQLAAQQLDATFEGTAARSRIVVAGGRTFLEVERFDRHGAFGRSPLGALDVLNAALIGGSAMDWPALTARLVGLKLCGAQDLQRVQWLWTFGQLIANTDMHPGNLSLRPDRGQLVLAPSYDMLPMGYAPLTGGEVPERSFAPTLPLPPQRATWFSACGAAVSFWQTAASDTRIGKRFRAVCAANADTLRRLRDKA